MSVLLKYKWKNILQDAFLQDAFNLKIVLKKSAVRQKVSKPCSGHGGAPNARECSQQNWAGYGTLLGQAFCRPVWGATCRFVYFKFAPGFFKIDRLCAWRPSAAIPAAQFHTHIKDESVPEKILSGFLRKKFLAHLRPAACYPRSGWEAPGRKSVIIFFTPQNRKGICGAHLPLQHKCGVKQLELPIWAATCKFDLFYKSRLYY